MLGIQKIINKRRAFMVYCLIISAMGLNKTKSAPTVQETIMQRFQEQYSITASDSAALLNNLANLYLIMDSTKLDTAIEYYHRAIKKDNSEPGFKLNLAIAYLMKNDTTLADQYFTLGLSQCDNRPERAYALLKLEIKSSKSEKGRPEEITETELKKRINASAKRLKSQKEKRKIKQEKERETRRAGPKSLDPDVIKEHLFWKY